MIDLEGEDFGFDVGLNGVEVTRAAAAASLAAFILSSRGSSLYLLQ